MTAPKGTGPESAATDPGAQKNAGSGRFRSSKPQPQDPQAAPKSWREVLPIHRAAELFPRMSADELRALGEDVVKNGLKSPIVLWRPDSRSLPSLLDGISRLDAIEIAASSPVIVGAGSAFQGQRRQRSSETFARIPHDRGFELNRRNLSGAAWALLIVLDRLIFEGHGKNPVKLTHRWLKAAGLSRFAAMRALRLLESAGVVSVERRRGRAPLVAHRWFPVA